MRINVFHNLKISIAFSLLSLPLASSTCTNWTAVPASQCPSCLSTYTIPIDVLECPQPNNDTSCTIPLKSYSVQAYHHIVIPATTSAPAQLNISHSIPASDALSIYALAPSTERVQYDSLNATVNTLSIPRADRKMELGTRKELTFVPFMNSVLGTPSGCANASLDGRLLMVLAPAYKGFPGDELEGKWVVVTSNISDDGANGTGMQKTSAGRGGGVGYGALKGLGVAAAVFSFL